MPFTQGATWDRFARKGVSFNALWRSPSLAGWMLQHALPGRAPYGAIRIDDNQVLEASEADDEGNPMMLDGRLQHDPQVLPDHLDSLNRLRPPDAGAIAHPGDSGVHQLPRQPERGARRRRATDYIYVLPGRAKATVEAAELAFTRPVMSDYYGVSARIRFEM